MELFTVSISNEPAHDIEMLYGFMEQQLEDVHNKRDGVRLSFTAGADGSEISCTAVLPGFELRSGGPIVYAKAGEAIAEYAIHQLERQWIRSLITKEYDEYGLPEEQCKIAGFCMQLLAESYDDHDASAVGCRRKSMIAAEVSRFLEEQTQLNIDGFARFRLRAYFEELRDVIEYAIEEYMMDKQYQEFIALLKYFVYIQEAKVPIVHLMHKGDNEFLLLSDRMQPIETSQTDGFVVETAEREWNYEDMVVSSLITVSPQKVHIHTRHPDSQVIQTIEQIFENRTAVCTYCPSCAQVVGDRNKHEHLTP